MSMTRGAYLKRIYQGKNCALCGGMRPAVNPEHSPPKVMFQGKDRPIGHEVPACERCNNGSGALDQLAAFVAMSGDPNILFGDRQMSEHEHKVARGTANNANLITRDGSYMIYESAVPVPVFDDDGQVRRMAYAVHMRSDVMAQLAKWCAKQVLAAWYVQMGHAASSRATITLEILTNATPPDAELEALIRQLGGDYTLTKGKESKIGEFSYKFSPNPKGTAAVMFAQYHGGTAFLALLNNQKTAKLSRSRMRYRFATNGHRGIHAIP